MGGNSGRRMARRSRPYHRKAPLDTLRISGALGRVQCGGAAIGPVKFVGDIANRTANATNGLAQQLHVNPFACETTANCEGPTIQSVNHQNVGRAP